MMNKIRLKIRKWINNYKMKLLIAYLEQDKIIRKRCTCKKRK